MNKYYHISCQVPRQRGASAGSALPLNPPLTERRTSHNDWRVAVTDKSRGRYVSLSLLRRDALLPTGSIPVTLFGACAMNDNQPARGASGDDHNILKAAVRLRGARRPRLNADPTRHVIAFTIARERRLSARHFRVSSLSSWDFKPKLLDGLSCYAPSACMNATLATDSLSDS